ncbi:MAG: hypothetical protein WCE21_01950 [Candidatus Babeliales bacterium]
MKYSMSIVMALVAGMACAHESFVLAPLTHEMVDAYQQKIERIMRRDYYIKAGAAASLIGLVAWCSYRIATAPSLPAQVTPPAESVSLPSSAPAFIEDTVISNEQIWKKLLEMSKNAAAQKVALMRYGVVYGSETWPEWFKNNVRYYADRAIVGVACTGLIALFNPFNKYYQQFDAAFDKFLDLIFHDDSIAWFMQSQVANIPSLTLLETYAKKLDALSWQNEQERDLWQSTAQLFVHSWHLYSKQVAALVGFMRYKAARYAQISSDHQQFMCQQADQLIQTVSREREYLQQLLNDEHDAHTFVQSITVLQTDGNQALKEIALLESLLD